MFPPRIRIRDCAPRDGLQGEQPVPAEARAQLALDLFAAGLDEVEVAAFVSPRAVPSMAGAPEVVATTASVPGVRRWVLVPNTKGAQLALDNDVASLTFTVSASPAYSEKNVGMTVEDSLRQLEEIRELAPDATVDSVVSFAFGSPYDEPLGVRQVTDLVRRCREIGVDAVTLADTTGVGSPRRLRAVTELTGVDVGLHLHDSRGTALVNAYVALELGIRRFDTALGGLGGSPFASSTGGNLATEELVLLAEELGVDTGVDLDALLVTGRSLSDLLGRPLPSRVAAAGRLPRFPE